MFQSYLSPIQTCDREGLRAGREEFQSYLSPIQTLCVFEAYGDLSSFNPILVQFKRAPERCE